MLEIHSNSTTSSRPSSKHLENVTTGSSSKSAQQQQQQHYQRYCGQHLNTSSMDSCGTVPQCPLRHPRRSFTPHRQSSCLDRCARWTASISWQTRRFSSPPMFTLSSASLIWCCLFLAAILATCGVVAGASQENLQAYLVRQSPQQLSLEQSFHRPTRSVAPSGKLLPGTSVGSLTQQQVMPQPQEQSRLAKLCQQTSNVLASVLPAPFGGLKRSILCQFFGQIPLKGSPEDESPQASVAVMQHLAPHQGYPNVALPLPMSAKHPIELVIDQHRRDYLLSKQQAQLDHLNNTSAQDLGASSSIMNYVYEKRLEVPKRIASGMKSSGFSLPIDQIFRPATRPQVSSSPLLSTSGWRIFNQFDSTTTSTPKPFTQKSADSTSTTGNYPSLTSTSPANLTSVTERSIKMKDDLRPTNKEAVHKEEKISLLVIGKPPQAVSQHQQKHQVAVTKAEPASTTSTTTTKRLEPLIKSTTTHATPSNPTPLEPSVRTIEVNAQIMNTSTIVLVPLASTISNNSRNNEPNGAKIAAKSSGIHVKPDSNQVRLREELVIASINNLTRIAFGNHLRDTVKVINKLIDQQSDLFSNVAGGVHKDPMVPAESKQPPSSMVNPSASTPKQAFNSSTTVKPVRQRPASKDGRPSKSRFVKQNSSQQRLSTTTKTRTTTAKQPAGSPFSFPKAEDDWRRITDPKSGSSSKSGQGSKAAIIGEMQQDKTPWLVSSANRKQSTTTAARASFQSWLPPDKSFTVSTAEDASLDLERKWDSKKQQPAASNQQTSGLALNRLSKDKLAKRDSLTTLKSYLTTRTPSRTTLSASAQTTGAQSRWMPTIILPGSLHPTPSPSTSKLPSSTTTVPPPTTTNSHQSSYSPGGSESSFSPSSTSTKAEPIASTREDHALASNEVLPSSEATYEARATESVNRYTTHLNDPNELLATTRRLSIQPLPQTAQTGEFFNADTIASWPERYQTRIGQAMEGSTVPMGDTTRRNGETYQSTTLSRHRMDVGSSPTMETTLSLAPVTSIYASSGTTGSMMMTTIPANHKLTTPLDHQSTTASSPQPTNLISSTNSGGPTISYSTASPHSVAYTLIGPYTQSDSDQDTGTGDEFPSIESDNPHGFSFYIEQPLNGSGGVAALRPPYADQHSVLNHPQSIDDLEDTTLALLDRGQYLKNQSYAQQRFLELLSPSFVSGEMQSYPIAPANNQQRFNLSALKYLAHNLLPSSRHTTENSDERLYRNNDSTSWQNHLLTSESNESTQVNSSSPPQIRSLLDLLSDAGWFSRVQANHYDSALLNDSLSSNNSSITAGLTNKGSKSILGRAGNLLSDLKQLEQKRAAALLAAIRYQVPGPLVKPWEITPSFYHFAGGNPNLATRISSRLDSDSGSLDQDYLVDDLLLNKLIRMALRKQRLVPRSVLEARLRPADKREDDPLAEHRLHSNEHSDQLASHKPVEHLRAANLDESSGSDMPGISIKTATKRLVSKLLNPELSNVRQDYNSEDFNQGHGAAELNKSHRPMSESGQANRLKEGSGESIANKRKPLEEEMKRNFECANRAAGFYPDAATTCRTFYHCSSTGHLLTFNCPQQSRFDEKSLKCGPWYEVSCDLRGIR